MTVTILSPLDLKPGSISPDGRVVKRARMYATGKMVVVDAQFTDGTSTALMWPSGRGWTVDGRTGE